MGHGQKTRNNHYVPQFYLKQWSNNGSSVLCYDTIVRSPGQKQWRSTSVKKTACWRDFYSQQRDGEIDDSIELHIEQKYETPASECLKKIRNGESLSGEELGCVVDFAILQMVRTPAWYVKTSSMTKELFPGVMRETMKGVLADYNAGRFDEMRRFDGYTDTMYKPPFPKVPIETRVDSGNNGIVSTISIGRDNYLASIGRILDGQTAKIMRSQAWAIVRMPNSLELPTSDNPFVRLEYWGRLDYGLDGGIGARGVDLMMPLTPKHLLIAEVGQPQKVSPNLLEDDSRRNLIVKAIVDNAFLYVYNREEDHTIPEMRPRVVNPGYIDQMRNNLEKWNKLQGD